jgi:RNA methyltransferase, RsmD family
MRFISGKYKGRNIEGYTIDGTRPTMDRVKESLFAIIQNHIKNSNILDLFAGSGSLGLEALSNDAKKCIFVDSNKIAIETITKTIKNINLEEDYELIKSDYKDALAKFKNQNKKFDIIFLDPPYHLNLITDAIDKIDKYDLLTKNGIIVCEYEEEKINTKKYNIYKEKRYGKTNILILNKRKKL